MHKYDRLTAAKRLRRYIFSRAIKLLFLSNSSRKETLKSCCEFVLRQSQVQKEHPNHKFYLSRERLIEAVVQNLGETWIGVEFGVAYGDLSRWMLRSGNLNRCMAWHGYDSFFGLPFTWGNLPAGTFSTGGKPPNLKEEIFNWHVGLVEDTTIELEFLNVRESYVPAFIVFDMDLYEPTSLVLSRLKPKLQVGDILFFDEAFHAEESQAIKEFSLEENNLSLEPIGFTIFAQCFRIVRI